jgi:hypothetical protein
VEFQLDGVGLGQVFYKSFGFSLSIIIPPVLHTHLSSGTGTIGSFETSLTRD